MDIIFLFAFLMVIVSIIGTLWVFADATVNSQQSAILWGLVAFFGGIVGILLYVLLGRETDDEDSSSKPESDRHRGNPTHECESCGEEYYANSSVAINTCRSCGGVKVNRTDFS